MSFIIILRLLHGCACFCRIISEWWLAGNFFARHTGYFIYIENVISDCGEKLCHIIFALRSEIYTGMGMVGTPRFCMNPIGMEASLRHSCNDRNKCRRTPVWMEKVTLDSCNATVLHF